MIIIGNDLKACEFRIDLAIEQKYFKHIVKQIQIALFKQTSGLVVRVLFRLKKAKCFFTIISKISCIISVLKAWTLYFNLNI